MNRKTDSTKNAVSVGSGIFISRIAGLVRSSFLAAYLGTGSNGDAFGAALRIPKILQNLLGEGSLSASFIPIYSQLLEDGDKKRARSVAGAVLGLLTIVIGLLTLAIVFLARPLTLILVPGFSGESEKYELTITLLKIMAPSIGFIALAAWCLGVLNSHRKFFLSYIIPAIWSLSIIIAILIANIYNQTGADLTKAAAYGVLIGGSLQFLIQLPFALKVSGRIKLSLGLRIQAVREIIKRFGPAVAGRGVVTLGSYVDLIFASLLATGAVAILDRAHAFYLLPISIFALSIAAAELPEISREQSQSEKIERRVLNGGQRVIFFLLFVSIIFIAGGHSIISAFYERVSFTSDDTIVVWLVLAAYSLGILASGLSRILQTASYGIGDVKTPARIALGRMLTSALFGVALMFFFDRFAIMDGDLVRSSNIVEDNSQGAKDFPHLGAIGLALGSIIGAWFEFALLKLLIQKQLRQNGVKRHLNFTKTSFRLFPGAILAGIVGAILAIWLSQIPALIAAPIVVSSAGIIYVLVSAKMGSPQAQSMLRLVKKILLRK